LKRIWPAITCALAVAALAGSPAIAAKKAAHGPTCKQIKDAVASGKTADEVAKDMNVSAARVKTCTAPPAKHHKKSTKKAS
jgi:hypothetical protein